MTELGHMLTAVIALLSSAVIPLLMCWLIARVALTWPARSPSSPSGSKGKTTVSGGGGGGNGSNGNVTVTYARGVIVLNGGSNPTAVFNHDIAPEIEDAGVTVGEIVGWRVWRSTWGYLHSAVRADIWPPGEPMYGDVTRNGVHAWKTQRAALQYANDYTNTEQRWPMVVGRVHLWGTVIEHERGYRAEYAKIISLDLIYPRNHETIETLIDLRQNYGLDESTPSA